MSYYVQMFQRVLYGTSPMPISRSHLMLVKFLYVPTQRECIIQSTTQQFEGDSD